MPTKTELKNFVAKLHAANSTLAEQFENVSISSREKIPGAKAPIGNAADDHQNPLDKAIEIISHIAATATATASFRGPELQLQEALNLLTRHKNEYEEIKVDLKNAQSIAISERKTARRVNTEQKSQKSRHHQRKNPVVTDVEIAKLYELLNDEEVKV
jgi:hypothetical protein